MKVIIDGDACPVKNEVYEVTMSLGVPVTLVASVDHYSEIKLPEHVSVTYVDRGADSADFKIVQLVNPGDCVVTQDYGLASLVIGKRANCIHHLGKPYDARTIDLLLESRHHNAQVRKSGGRTKGPSKMTASDRAVFKKEFEKILK